MKLKNRMTKKKDAVTLIEVVAALAIMSILAAVLVPKVSKYVEEAKKTRALEDVRQVVLAVEDYNMSSPSQIAKNNTFSYIKLKVGDDLINTSSIQTISDSMTYESMQNIVEGKKKFTLKDGKIKIT